MARHKQTTSRFTFHEDFSGAGMARIGLGSAWECLRACDVNPKKCASYRTNFPQNNLFEGDITQVDVENAKQADLAWASFPCQDTSLAGGYAGLAGERSGTFWSWWRIVEGMKNAGKPYNILCIENVRGLLTSNNGTDFAAICEALAKAGYAFGAAVIDAKHFLPQSRERLFIVGVRGNKALVKASRKTRNPLWHPDSMISAHAHLTLLAKENWFWLNPRKGKVKKPTLQSIIKKDAFGASWHSPKETAKLIAMMSTENRRKLSEQKKTKKPVIGMLYKRIRNGKQQAEIRFDGTAGCLRTAKGGSSRQTVIFVEGGKVCSRLLTTREAASLMGLPKSYKLPKTYNEAYNLCGDGVAVPVVNFLARKVFVPVLASIARNSNI